MIINSGVVLEDTRQKHICDDEEPSLPGRNISAMMWNQSTAETGNTAI